MPRPTKKGPKVQPIGNVAVEEPPNPATPPQTPPLRGRRDPVPTQATFFQRIAKVARPDWGTRANIKVYRLEPIIDRLRGSENKYITVYNEPITEEKLKIDHGSGRYRLYYTFKQPAGPDKEIDSVELDIMDLNFPPKVPPGEWVDDGRNKKWAWAKPAGAPGAPATPTVPPLESAYETVLDIQDRERQRNGEKTTDISQFTGMISAVKSILPTPPAATDNTMLTTIVTLLTAQINSTQQEAAQLRKQVFDLITAKQGEKTGLAALVEEANTLFPQIKTLLNLGGDKLTEVVHGRPRKWWEDILIQTVPPVVQSFAPVIPMMVGNLMQPRPNGMNGSNGNGGINGNPPQQPQLLQGQQQLPPAATPMQQLMVKVGNFLGANMRPLQKYFDDYLAGKLSDPDDPESAIDGVDFAMWLVDYHGEQILKDARALGSAQIMQMFRGSVYWPAIQPHEAKLSEFLDQVLSYTPEPEEGGEGPIDLTQGGQEA